ncbi:MAG: hydroxyacylglutathione hydrolase [Pseudohongiellaceae bacterium]|jgi:hydroxyacylglutathione hydrolase
MIKIEPILAFDDNYIWCLYDTTSQQACIVDPGQSEPVERFLSQRGLSLESIIVTHHHYDHVGGIASLKAKYDAIIHGPVNPDISVLDKHYHADDQVTVIGIDFQVLEVPGHTLDHIAFYSPNINNSPVLFCGDTLFAGGCGRLFEGTPELMYQSLQQLSDLPDNTLVYCAHEYTLANLAFAAAVEPNNQELIERIRCDSALRKRHTPTVPTYIGLEQQTNPFLRSHLPSIKISAEQHTGKVLNSNTEVFAALREWKNQF